MRLNLLSTPKNDARLPAGSSFSLAGQMRFPMENSHSDFVNTQITITKCSGKTENITLSKPSVIFMTTNKQLLQKTWIIILIADIIVITLVVLFF
jgi:hypothetical protein